MVAGTLNNVFATPLATMGITGTQVSALTTTAKTLVPAVNELKATVDLLAIGTIFVGSFDASAGTILWTAASGGTGNALPAPGPGNRGWQLVCDAAGSTPPGTAPAGAYDVGDWLASNGAIWTHLQFGGAAAITASAVPVTPPVAGGSNVQDSLTNIDADNAAQDVLIAAKADTTYVDAENALDVKKVGDTMTGPLELPLAAPTLAVQAANKAYVDAQVALPKAVVADGVSITGTGLAANPITLALVDGGTF
jgi:hypothetical protein